MTPEQKAARIAELKPQHAAAKAAEKAAQQKRIEIEGELYTLVQSELKDSGTSNHAHGLKVVTGYSEKWDQEKLNELYNNDKGLHNLWPFKAEWKKDGPALKVVKDRDTDAYLKLTQALTMTPSKPAFSFKEEE